MPQPPLSTLHYTIVRHVVDHGFAPDLSALSGALDCSEDETAAGLDALQAEHGVVLHPHSTRIWVIHPFSLAPTTFWVQAGEKSWWGNCAWCYPRRRKRRQTSRTAATTASRSSPVMAGKIGRLTVRRQTSLATGRCSGRQPKDCQ